ncbi:MAG: c-type cytochrome [Gammaproteobacteria bacterium]
MKITTFYSLTIALLSLAASETFAADVNAGKQLAASCSACHGADGNSKSPQWPSLAGQQPVYLRAQLIAFRDGARENAVMKGRVAKLSDDDIDNLAAYFAGLKPASAGGDAALATVGAEKYTMCSGCHGAKGAGNGVFPRLAGQHPAYLLTQLKNFKSGARQGGPMAAITANLSEDDMKALSEYAGSLE